MSERVGMMAIGDREQEVFLGRDFAQRREVSEHTARIVDEEVKALLDAAYQRAHVILTEQRDLLDRVASALLERETVDHDDVMTLFRGGTLPPLPPELPEPAKLAPAARPDAAPVRAPILGMPPAEPAGA
jgi:cell division protease FtsH